MRPSEIIQGETSWNIHTTILTRMVTSSGTSNDESVSTVQRTTVKSSFITKESNMKTLKPVTKRLVKQLEQEIINLNKQCNEALADYTPNIELGYDNSDSIGHYYDDKIEWVESFIDELTGDK